MDNFKNEHNSAADGDTLVFESPAAATNANGEPADGGNSGFFKKTFASVRSFFAKLFSDKKGANESMHSKPNNKNHSRAKRISTGNGSIDSNRANYHHTTTKGRRREQCV